MKESISVTNLIEKFRPQFDQMFWAKYKALEKLLGDDFKMYRKQLLDTHIFDDSLIDLVDKLEFNTEVNRILDEYAAKSKASRERGDALHAMLEGTNKYLPRIYQEQATPTNFRELIEDGVYKEFTLAADMSEDVTLVGRPDVIIKQGNKITIIDYKTGKEIRKTGHYNTRTRKAQTLYYPLNFLEDCEFSRYSIQISLYGYLIKKLYPEYKFDRLIILHIDYQDNVTEIDCENLIDRLQPTIDYYLQKRNISLKMNKLNNEFKIDCKRDLQ